MSKSGFDNENIILSFINGKKYSELNENMQRFVKYIFPNISSNDIVFASSIGGINKSDMGIEVNGLSYNISIKEGSGNSVHQEPVEEFITYLKNDFDINDQISNDIRFFIWGDRTLNGSGEKAKRLNANQLKKMYPELLKRINDFFQPIKKELISRFIVNGSDKSTVAIDYIYHGNVNSGSWESASLLIDKILNDEGNSAIPIGGLTFQARNRAIGENTLESTEKKRGVIQLKFPGIKKYLIS